MPADHKAESTIRADSAEHLTHGSNQESAGLGETSDFNPTQVTFTAMAVFDALTADQRARIVVPFEDSNRTHWNFLPESGRRGVPLKELDHAQTILVHRLIAQSMSPQGYARVLQVISLEHLLRELNLDLFGHVARDFRDPGNYFLTFFDQPQPDSIWGWRLVGHHLSLNVTCTNQDELSVTPFLLGSEPGRFGPFRPMGEEEDLGFAFLNCLDEDQGGVAVIHHKPPADFVTRTVPKIGDVELPGYHGVGRT